MRALDTAILGLDFGNVGGSNPLRLYDSVVEFDTDGKTVLYDLPYGVYYASIGDEHSPRLTGRTTRRAKFFSITYVGATRDQTAWAGERFRAALVGRRLSIPSHRLWLIGLEESQRIRRDDDAVRLDGSPLFYGVDNYAVSITTSPVQPELSA